MSGRSSGSPPDFGPAWTRPRPKLRSARRRGAFGPRIISGSSPQHGGRVADVGTQVGLGVGERDAVLGRVAAGQQRRAARRAHRRVGEGAAEGEAVLLQGVLVRRQVAQPAREVGPVARITLLIGDQQQDVGGLRGRGLALVLLAATGQPTSTRTGPCSCRSRSGSTGPSPAAAVFGCVTSQELRWKLRRGDHVPRRRGCRRRAALPRRPSGSAGSQATPHRLASHSRAVAPRARRRSRSGASCAAGSARRRGTCRCPVTARDSSTHMSHSRIWPPPILFSPAWVCGTSSGSLPRTTSTWP